MVSLTINVSRVPSVRPLALSLLLLSSRNNKLTSVISFLGHHCPTCATTGANTWQKLLGDTSGHPLSADKFA
jgi:hypothetical protein